MRRGVRFTEQMKGWLSFDETDFNQALLHGRVNGTSAKVRLAVEIRDLDRFIAERSEQAAASGWLEVDELGGRLMVEAGGFSCSRRCAPAATCGCATACSCAIRRADR